jgi:hypothetical protein
VESEHLAGLAVIRAAHGEHTTPVTTASVLPGEQLVATLRATAAPAGYLARASAAATGATGAGGAGAVFVIPSSLSPGNLVPAERYTTDLPAEFYRTHLLAHRS